jgi:transposase
MGVRARTSKEGSGNMPQETRIVGLDVANSKVDACIRSVGLCFSAPSTPEGEAKMILWVQANRVGRAVMEASGGYERSWAEILRTAGVDVVIVDPKRIRHFAKAAGRLAKNDPIDADTIAWFAETFPIGGAQPQDPAREEVDRRVQARGALKDMEERIKQQGEHQPPPLVVQALRALAKATRAERRKLDAAIAAKIKANPGFARRAEIIASVPGLADQTVAGVIAWMPELGRISNAAAAELIGAAPYDDDSGDRKGVRSIKGGRRKLRTLLYMPVMGGAATLHNPVLKASYQRLIARGKEAKVAIIACMRKLIVILNTMLARDQTWNPPACV